MKVKDGRFTPDDLCAYCGKPLEDHISASYSSCVVMNRVPEPNLESINEELITNAEQAIQSLCKLIRSLGFDPAQFIDRALERENREKEIEELRWPAEHLFTGESEHGSIPNERYSIRPSPVNSDDRFNDAIDEIRRFNEDENASEGAKERKNQMRPI